MEADQGSFTLLIFTVNGGMAGECKLLYSRLVSLLLIKHGIEKSQVATWENRKINFTLKLTLSLSE